MRGGRSHWKIENETFNTLKNQGYHFEHNYGHGYQHLSVVLAMLMLLAFLVDQTQQLCCPQFAAAWKMCISKRALWERLREIVHQFSALHARDLRSRAFDTQTASEYLVGFVISGVGLPLKPALPRGGRRGEYVGRDTIACFGVANGEILIRSKITCIPAHSVAHT